jgi:hypothetical protein
MSEFKKFYVVADKDGDREGSRYDSKADAIEWARQNVYSIYEDTAYIFEAVAVVKPVSQPITVIDL